MSDTLRSQAQILAARLPPLLVAARRVAQTVALGVHGRRRAGPGEVFWQFRPLRPGDDAAAIDWRGSARSDHLFLRETEWAAAQTVWLWRDGTASMDWRSAPFLPTKRERADLLILALAALLLKAGERVALASGHLPPTGGRGALDRLAEALEIHGGGRPQRPLPDRATAVLAGDFLDPPEETEALIRRLGPGGHLIRILDPAEEDMPFGGRIRFVGPEGEGEWLVRRAETLRAPYAARLAAHGEVLAALARATGWSLTTHRTDQPPQHALLAAYRRLAEAPAR